MTGYAGHCWRAFAGADDRSSAANASEGHVGNVAHVVSTTLLELRIRCKLQKAFAEQLFGASSVRYVNPSNNMCFRYVGALEDLYARSQVLHGEVLCRSGYFVSGSIAARCVFIIAKV